MDFGFVGDVDRVNAKPLQHLLAGDYVPVVCSLAADSSGQIYNVNADTLAACDRGRDPRGKILLGHNGRRRARQRR